jgi:hypothetical protein
MRLLETWEVYVSKQNITSFKLKKDSLTATKSLHIIEQAFRNQNIYEFWRSVCSYNLKLFCLAMASKPMGMNWQWMC